MGRKVKEQRSRGQIVPRGEKKWLVRVYTGKNAAGERIYSSKTVNGTFSQAQQALTGLLREVDTEQYVVPANQTLGDFLNSWLTDTAPISISAGTAIGYRSAMTRVIDELGTMRLDKLTPQMIQRLYSGMAEEDLSSRYIQYTHTILKNALDRAVIWRLIAKNPTDGAVRPPRVEADEPEVFSSEEVDLFLEAAKTHQLGAMWMAFLTTGLRPQEMFALKWADMEARTIRIPRDGKYVEVPSTVLNIQRAMVHVGKGKYEVSSKLKTKKSKRSVSIPQALVTALTAHRRQQAETMLASGESFERNDYIFPNRVGRPLDVNNVRDQFHTLCRAAEVKEIKLYGLRHTHATLLLIAGVGLKTVSERLGHSSIMLTADTYSHVLPETQHETAMTIDTLIRRSQK